MASARDSSAAKRTPDRSRGTAQVAAAHRSAALIRAADERAVEWARAGRTGLVVPATGLEVLLGATAAAMKSADWALPGVRQSPIALARGLAPVSWFAQVLGRIADPSRGRQEPYHPSVRSLNVFSVSTPTGSQFVHAAGVGRAMLRAGHGEVAVAFCGGAASASADFHVGLNFAAVWGVPAVFIVARVGRLGCQSATEGVAIKAEAHGLPAVEVDGGDVRAVLEVVSGALARARAGEGPTLIDAACPEPEAAGPHASGPRLVEEGSQGWAERDPLARAALLVEGAGAVEAEVRHAVEEAAAAALALPAPPAELLFQDVFARRTPALDEQRDEWLRGRRPGRS